LIRLTEDDDELVLGYLDEVWWSRFSQPKVRTWGFDKPRRMVQREADKTDAEPKAIACYGLLRKDTGQVKVRFLEERPISPMTISFLKWIIEELAKEGKKALFLIWDNATWHNSKMVCQWIKENNRKAKQAGGVRIIRCQLPSKSPWLNPIEPHWMHGKKAICEPNGKLTKEMIEQRVCEYFDSEQLPRLSNNVM
jgi:transposase